MSVLKIGWASRNVSTDKPVNIPGQFNMRISQGIIDPVTVTALVLDSGDDLVVFLSCDLVVIRSGLVDEVREKTAKLIPGFPVEKIILNATHAHTGPSHYDNSGWDTKSENNGTGFSTGGIEIASGTEYRHFLSTSASEAIAEAYNARNEGGIAFGYGYAVVSHSRRVIYFDDISKRGGNTNGFSVDGHGRMYGNTNDDNFSGYESGSDHFINLLYTFTPEGKLTGAIVNVPCPSQNSEAERKLSADYWNDVRTLIHEQYGDINILPQCAPAGDLSPRILHYREAQDRRFRLKYGGGQTEMNARRDIAERIFTAFGEVLSWARKDIITDLPIKHIVKNIGLEKRRITEDEYDFCVNSLADSMKEDFITEGDPIAILDHNSSLAAVRNRYVGIIERYRVQDTEPYLDTEIHVLKLGDIAFCTNRFELYMDFMHRIQARSPFTQTFVIQLAGVPGAGGGSYLATEKGASNKGYSACLFCNLVSPAGGQQLVNETVKILKEIR